MNNYRILNCQSIIFSNYMPYSMAPYCMYNIPRDLYIYDI